MDDQEIVKGIQQGDEAAFETLDKELRSSLHDFMKATFDNLNAHEAEEAIQETFIKIYEKASEEGFKIEHSLKAFAKKILRNKAIDILRKKVREASGIKTAWQAPENIIEETMDIECNEAAWNLFCEEHINEANILILSAVRGLNPKEIATQLGIRYGAARQRISDARKKLRLYREHCE